MLHQPISLKEQTISLRDVIIHFCNLRDVIIHFCRVRTNLETTMVVSKFVTQRIKVRSIIHKTKMLFNIQLEILQSLGGMYDGLAFYPLHWS